MFRAQVHQRGRRGVQMVRGCSERGPGRAARCYRVGRRAGRCSRWGLERVRCRVRCAARMPRADARWQAVRRGDAAPGRRKRCNRFVVQECSRARCRRIVFPPLQIICSLCCCRTCWLPSTASAGANKRSAQKPRVSQVCRVPSASVRVASIVNRRGHQHVAVAVARAACSV